MLSVEYVCVRVRVFFCECIGGSVCACMSAYMCLFIYLCMEVGGWGHMSSSLPRAHQLAMLSVQWDPGIWLFVCAPPFPQHWGHKWVPPCLTAFVGAGLWTIILMLVWLYTLYTLNHLSATGVCFKCFSKAGTKPKTLITAKPKALGPIPQVYILFRWRFFLLWLSHLIFQKQFDYKSFNFLLETTHSQHWIFNNRVHKGTNNG